VRSVGKRQSTRLQMTVCKALHASRNGDCRACYAVRMPHAADRLSRRLSDVAPGMPRVPLAGTRTRPHSSLYARRLWRWGGFALLLAVSGWLVWPEGGRNAPPPRPQAQTTQTLLEAAAQALQRGQLSAADGSGARQLYAAALARNPDEPKARRGLVATGLAALEAAQQALARGDLEDARNLLELARQLQVPRVQLDTVADALRQAALAHTPLEVLLERADAARHAGQDDTALALYQQILALQPGHATALRARGEVLAALLDVARAQVRAGELEAAAAAVAGARRFDPGHPDLPDTLARLTEERAALQQQAEAAFAGGELTAALALWQRLLALDEGDARAQAGIARSAQALAERATALAEHTRIAEAAALLAQARALAPDAPAVRAAELRIERARAQQPATAHAASLQALGECFDARLAANDLRHADECLQSASAQGEDVGTLAARRRALALRWLAIAEERLGRAELAAAAAALASARRSDPAAPGLDAFARRLQAAGP